MARVLVVEDDPDDQAFAGDAIERQPALELAGIAGSCAEARQALSAQRVDAAVLDVMLPDGSGLDLLEPARGLGLPALLMTGMGDEETVAEAITRGATGYLLKETDAGRLGDAIVRILDGEAPLNARVARYLLDRVPARASDTPAPSKGQGETLTPTENRVLELIAQGHTHIECAEVLQRSAHTVNTHIKNIYAKLAVGSRAEAVSQAVAQGLLDPGQLVPGSGADDER
jgi:DNA-binding NarL/FixJ family response regulator